MFCRCYIHFNGIAWLRLLLAHVFGLLRCLDEHCCSLKKYFFLSKTSHKTMTASARSLATKDNELLCRETEQFVMP